MDPDELTRSVARGVFRGLWMFLGSLILIAVGMTSLIVLVYQLASR